MQTSVTPGEPGLVGKNQPASVYLAPRLPALRCGRKWLELPDAHILPSH